MVLASRPDGRGETVVTLPVGASEHFMVQGAATNPLLRITTTGVLSGTNVVLGSMGEGIMLQADGLIVGSITNDGGVVSMVVGTNTVNSPTSSFVLGDGHYLYAAPYAGLFGGRENRMVFWSATNGSSSPYHSVIVGGYRNAITGAQYAAILGGQANRVGDGGSSGGTVLGGYRNTVTGKYATTVGGQYNVAGGTNALAAGSRAQALHHGAFVWADISTSTAFSSSNDNEFAIRAAGGVRIDSDLGTAAIPSRKSRYGDNNIVAWARVGSDGTTSTNHFGVNSVTRTNEGIYEISLDASMSSASTLIPVASVDTYGLAAPTNAASARLIYVERTAETNRFKVRTTNGSFAPTNTPFTFIVTGR